jgi:cell division transport system permease protein
MICLVIGIAMCLPGLFYVGADNLSKLTNHMQDETEISLFLKLGASTETIAKVDALLAKNSAIKQFHLVTKEEAWQQLQAKSEIDSDVGNVIHQLTKNPLPDAFFIQAKSTEPEALNTLKNELETIPGVEQALLNTEWAKRLATLIALAKKIILFIAVLLAIALLIIIGNTVRMQILTQKDEIEVSNLMGASSSFIRVPFLYAGILYGFFGGLLALLIMACIIKVFNYSVLQISSLYSNDFSLPLFNSNLSIIIISAAVVIGWLGSYLAVTRSIASFKIN